MCSKHLRVGNFFRNRLGNMYKTTGDFYDKKYNRYMLCDFKLFREYDF